ncbi:MAG: class I SAM-dependent methyltransferase [Gammaproteobacteria bacterium]|jgi:hypothetical protein
MGSRSRAISSHFKENQKLVGVEVGVRYGKNAEALLGRLPNLTLCLVDRWEKPVRGDSYYNSGDGIADRPNGHFRKCYNEMLHRTKRYANRVHVRRQDSLSAAADFLKRGMAFDFIFIDADHSYEGVKRDIQAWWLLVKDGGYLCGHDYNHPRIGEVKRAVDEVFDSVELMEDMTWFVKKNDKG